MNYSHKIRELNFAVPFGQNLNSENWRCLFENIRTELTGLGGRNSPHTPLPPAEPCLPDRNS